MSGGMRAGQDALAGKNYDQAIALWEEIAENGSPIPFFNPQTKAQQKIGHVHAFRDDEKDDIDEAIKWWKRAGDGHWEFPIFGPFFKSLLLFFPGSNISRV